jgi:hypothetical protein
MEEAADFIHFEELVVSYRRSLAWSHDRRDGIG